MSPDTAPKGIHTVTVNKLVGRNPDTGQPYFRQVKVKVNGKGEVIAPIPEDPPEWESCEQPKGGGDLPRPEAARGGPITHADMSHQANEAKEERTGKNQLSEWERY